jgi:predicted outer membrane lipoprotein
MKLIKAMLGGVIGATTISVVTAGLRAAGVPINFELMLGSLFTESTSFGAWLLGLVLHLIVGSAFGVVYALIFEHGLYRASWGLGMVVSLAHLALAGFALAGVPVLHPLVPGALPAPGPMMLGYGTIGLVTFVVLHLMFGAIVGGFYGSTREGVLPGKPERPSGTIA